MRFIWRIFCYSIRFLLPANNHDLLVSPQSKLNLFQTIELLVQKDRFEVKIQNLSQTIYEIAMVMLSFFYLTY